MNIKGDWRGYYEYGVGYLLPLFGERSDFEITLDGPNESFTDTSTEKGKQAHQSFGL